ncbi:type IV secretory system conjugative DNA transfer family protein [Streptomyces chilikensis]|uniref:Type IV secretory system conjugative DNA transfer family protein n=1 Tax=Streptomyces chilikensis TaxID=1194079 RepID=A0ABV3ERG0_9ACTN
MSLDQHTPTTAPAAPTPEAAPAGASATERRIAIAESLAPVAVGVLAPLLDGGATALLTGTYAAAAAFTITNSARRIPAHLLERLPAGDIADAHRSTLFTSTLTTGIALGIGSIDGAVGTDALMAGALDPMSIPGIVSLGWWAAVALVPFKLRRVLSGRARRPKTLPAVPGQAQPVMPLAPLTGAEEILRRWATYISHPTDGTHRQQILTHVTLDHRHWTGVIVAPTGSAVTVNTDTISSVFQIPTAQVHLTDGAHAGEKHLTVRLTPPPELDPATLAGAWAKWVSRPGGAMAGTHLEDVQTDPNTGGEVAYVVAGETLNRLPTPDRAELAGALRTNTLLCSYSPVPGDPRRGTVRLMKHNPLQDGVPFPGTHVLKISDGGYVQIGRHVSGFPARIQFTDPALGARHLFIAGVTGSGKGGLIQIVALADHVNGHAIIYGDPKGSSNPDVETMACYSGLGEDGVMGALRVAYALLQWRIEESARLKMKNFVATPDRPWVRLILDEAHVPLSELVEHKKEAAIIVEALAAKARSLGIIVTLVNQAVNAEKLGGSTALRMNVIQGGSLVMLRSDSGQQHLVTTGFEGVDPGEIPASWDVERPLVYNEGAALQDPKATFGLGYTLGPGGAAEMMRTFILESAAPYIDPNAIAYPADWPDWANRHEIAATSILGEGDGEDGDGSTIFDISSLPPAPKKPASADEKILAVLEEAADPLGIDTIYLHKDQIGEIAGLKEGSTRDNAFTRLYKAGKIHRKPGERGVYGLGPTPDQAADDGEE